MTTKPISTLKAFFNDLRSKTGRAFNNAKKKKAQEILDDWQDDQTTLKQNEINDYYRFRDDQKTHAGNVPPPQPDFTARNDEDH
ncbi:1926_t:CDS:2 [Funneliformis geosporum]|uniref:1926_t:CDS:1 n=1 Tax=Funneliformis geosporum TaxID=1117311 RepID=A0A9W4WPQ9_9GLOM|nr:1926_t:CDS:2 [Funneliformis geosporum]